VVTGGRSRSPRAPGWPPPLHGLVKAQQQLTFSLGSLPFARLGLLASLECSAPPRPLPALCPATAAAPPDYSCVRLRLDPLHLVLALVAALDGRDGPIGKSSPPPAPWPPALTHLGRSPSAPFISFSCPPYSRGHRARLASSRLGQQRCLRRRTAAVARHYRRWACSVSQSTAFSSRPCPPCREEAAGVSIPPETSPPAKN
jgi:hypothetical protein